MRIRDQEYGASLDLQHRYPFPVKFSFVEVGQRNPRILGTPISEPSRGVRRHMATSCKLRRLWQRWVPRRANGVNRHPTVYTTGAGLE